MQHLARALKSLASDFSIAVLVSPLLYGPVCLCTLLGHHGSVREAHFHQAYKQHFMITIPSHTCGSMWQRSPLKVATRGQVCLICSFQAACHHPSDKHWLLLVALRWVLSLLEHLISLPLPWPSALTVTNIGFWIKPTNLGFWHWGHHGLVKDGILYLGQRSRER